jgi:hypothetical protein
MSTFIEPYLGGRLLLVAADLLLARVNQQRQRPGVERAGGHTDAPVAIQTLDFRACLMSGIDQGRVAMGANKSDHGRPPNRRVRGTSLGTLFCHFARRVVANLGQDARFANELKIRARLERELEEQSLSRADCDFYVRLTRSRSFYADESCSCQAPSGYRRGCSRMRAMVVHRLYGAFMNRRLIRHGRIILGRCHEPSALFARAITALGLSDPRAATRVPCRGAVFCHPVALQRTRSCQAAVHDLSLTGIGLFSAAAFEPGKVLAISFPRTIGDVPQPLLMAVVHVGDAGNGLCRMGGLWTRPLTLAQLHACLHVLRAVS